MSPWLQWLTRHVGLLAVSAACLLLGRAVWGRPERGLQRVVLTHRAQLAHQLEFLNSPLPPTLVAGGQLACFAMGLVGAACVSLPLGTALSGLSLSLGPWLQGRVDRRLVELEAHLEPWLLALGRALTSAASLGQALSESAAMVEGPLRHELRRAVRELGLGVGVADALQRMAERVGSASLSTAVAAVRIGQRTGGGLGATLSRSAETLREMARLDGVVRMRTAEGRAQANVVAVIPLPMVALLHYLNPGLLEPLVGSPEGWCVLTGAALMWLAALLSARRILRVDI